jgi:hypothetical protein
MSLILPDEEQSAIRIRSANTCLDCTKAIARAQARHMAREIVGWVTKDAGANTYIHQLDLGESLEAWLRQEGVL